MDNRDILETNIIYSIEASEEDNIAEIDYIPLKNEKKRVGVGNTKTTPIKQSIQLINHFFTWNNYPDNWLETIEPVFKQIAKKWVFQKEIGPEGTPHIQGNISLKKKMRWEEFKLPTQIHWEKTHNLKAAFEYCAKDGTRDGIETWYYPNNVIQHKLKLIDTLRPWQASICSLISEKIPDDRTINWVYDEEGCMGKTVFSKYLFSKHSAIIATSGGNKDIACLLAILKKEGRDLNATTTFVFNFPRSCEGISYKAIESVKDGLMTSIKYETSTLIFNCPHVWIFSNELPILHKLSTDRWKLWTITNEQLIDYNELKYGKFELIV